MLKVSFKLVEEAESQFYDDDNGSVWLLVNDYKMPPNIKPKVEPRLGLGEKLLSIAIVDSRIS